MLVVDMLTLSDEAVLPYSIVLPLQIQTAEKSNLYLKNILKEYLVFCLVSKVVGEN